ncbi:MAG: hypothetical protein KAT04_10015 [Methylococcales bacterium]|nr:hypothetical protein [Methylococcales bacterium]
MILIPLEELARVVGKGLPRKIISQVTPIVGISEKTLLNAVNGQHHLSKKTISKIDDQLSQSKINYDSCSDLYGVNTWRVLVEGFNASGVPDELFPVFRKTIIELGLLDEELERNSNSPEAIKELIRSSSIDSILKDEINSLNAGLSNNEMHAYYSIFQVRVLLYIMSCFDVELLWHYGKLEHNSLFNDLFSVDNSPKKVWIKSWMKNLNLTSINELSIKYSLESNLDEADAMRHIRKIISDSGKPSFDTLKILADLSDNDLERDGFFLGYYLSEIINYILLTSKEEVRSEFKKHLKSSYSDYFQYWKSLKANTPTPVNSNIISDSI